MSMWGHAKRSFRYEQIQWDVLSKVYLEKQLTSCILFPEVSSEVHWPNIHWRWERWSGPERAVIHAEAGRGNVIVLSCSGCLMRDVKTRRKQRIELSWHGDTSYSFLVLQISVVGDPVLNVNCCHVQTFDAELYRQLISYPQVQAPS